MKNNTPSHKQSSPTNPTISYLPSLTLYQPTREQAAYKSSTFPHPHTKQLMK